MQKKIICILFSLISITGIAVIAQQQNTDSLQKVIAGNAANEEKIKACKELAYILLLKNFDGSLSASANGKELAEKIKDSAAIGEFLKLQGIGNYFKGNFDSAAIYYYKALDVLNKNTFLFQRAGVLNELGKLYRKTKDLDRALQNYDEAFSIYKKLNKENEMATIYNESGVVFEYKGNYEEAINRYKKSLAIKQKLKDTVGIGYSYNFLGGVYTLQKKFDEAEKNLLLSLKIRQQLKDSFAIALNYADMGAMYNEEGDYTNAINSYQLSNTIAGKMKYADLLLGNYKELAAIAEKKGDAALSLSYLKKHFAIKDSVFANEKMKQIEELNAKYQSEKKEQQLRLQKSEISKKNFLLTGLLTISGLLVFAGFMFYRKKQVQNKLTMQAAVMKQQDMAAKAVIAAEENERKRIAADLHDGVGQMMSAAKMNFSAFENDIVFTDEAQKISFDKAISLLDESCKEIRSVSHQMMPNALLKSGLANAVKEFIDKLDNRILKVSLHTEGLNERLDSDVETILYRVIQECVNNVIKHAGASALDISLIKDEEGIAATIEDNGKGFDITDKSKFEGIGLKNISSRINYLKGTVEIDSRPGHGTLVAIHIPFV